MQVFNYKFTKLYGMQTKEVYKMMNLFKLFNLLSEQRTVDKDTVVQLKKVQDNFTQAATLILKALPYRDINSVELKETPKRFAKMMLEQLQGEFLTDDQIAQECKKIFPSECKDMVVIKNIQCFSHCEHHIALMYNMSVNIGYLPKGYILGLSKFARVVDLVSKRLQTQEKMGTQLISILNKMIPNNGIIVQINAEHSCMTARGIQQIGSITSTIHKSDSIKEEDINYFYKLLEAK